LTRPIVFVASRYDRFWCETGAVIGATRSLRLPDGDTDRLREAAANAIVWRSGVTPDAERVAAGNDRGGHPLQPSETLLAGYFALAA
jgi:hypothetical protein